MLPGKKYGIQDYLAVAKRYWWIVAATTIVGAFTALVVSASEHDTFESEMLIQIIPQRVPDAIVRSTVTVKTEDRMDSLEAQVKSRVNMERLIREFNLYPEDVAAMPMEDVVAKLRGAIKIDLVRAARHLPADSFYVRFTYSNADTAARVTSAIGNMFIAENARERKDLAGGTNKFLAIQLAEAKGKLDVAEQRMERFRLMHAGRLPTERDFNLQAVQTTQSQLQASIEATARDRDRRQTVQRMYADALATPIPVSPVQASPAAANDPNAAATVPLATQLTTAENVLQALERRLKEGHPDLRRQRKIVADLRAKVAAEPKQAGSTASVPTGVTNEEVQRRERLNAYQAEIESLDRQIAFKESEEKKLRATIAEYQGKLAAIPGVESEWLALTRDYETLKTSYENFLRKSEDSRVAADLEEQQVGEQFRVVDSAKVPVHPVGAVRVQTNAIGTAAGMLLGVGIVAFLFVRDTTFHSEADVLDVLRLPVLALVPLVVDAEQMARARRRRMLVASLVAVAVVGAGVVAWQMQLWRFVV
ncbi:MAG TPA: GNVR domain-containing protein [Vicinamibacterales bacterium]|nr:GNVR domain-containing protein [Vicinamibacterales bacterium]